MNPGRRKISDLQLVICISFRSRKHSVKSSNKNCHRFINIHIVCFPHCHIYSRMNGMFSAKRCLFAQCFFMWRLISVRSTCFSQLGHVAFLSSPKCSSLMCLLQLDWLENVRSQVRQAKVPSTWRWQSWLAASSIATVTG